MLCCIVKLPDEVCRKIKSFTTAQAVRRSAAHWFNFKKTSKKMRYSNINVVYVWFKYKDYMLYGGLKLCHVLWNYKTDSEFLSSVIFVSTNSSFLYM